jgi:sulfonate transport system substrate-binding protein
MKSLVRCIAQCILVVGGGLFAYPGMSAGEEYFDRYGLSASSSAVDLGIQPLGYPSGVISAVMRHDRILRKALADMRQPLKVHAFLRGADMVALLADRRLEAALLGDMPTILAASTGNVWIVGLVKQTSSAVVAKGDVHVKGLAGKRIGYVAASSAHHTLLQGLASAGLGEHQVKLVALRVDDMPAALERGEIDAFVAWEPGPSIALGKSEKNHIVFRGLSTDYFVVEREFAKRSPEAAHHVIAGFLRAIEWMRRSQGNAEKAARWAIVDTQAFSGKRPPLSVAQVVAITRREILNIPSAPTIPITPGAMPLKDEFQFLAKLGKLPAEARLENVEASFRFDGLARVIAEPGKFRVGDFDYEE